MNYCQFYSFLFIYFYLIKFTEFSLGTEKMNPEEAEKHLGIASISFEEQKKTDVKHGTSFFSQREALMNAAEEDRDEVKEEEEEKIVTNEQKLPSIRNTAAVSTGAAAGPLVVDQVEDNRKTNAEFINKENKTLDTQEGKQIIIEYKVNGLKVPKTRPSTKTFLWTA